MIHLLSKYLCSSIQRLGRFSLLLVVLTVSGCATRDTSSILVSTDRVTLTRNDYEAAIRVVPKAKREQISPTLKQTMLFLENAMIFRVLANEAKELGLDNDPIVQKEMQQAVERLLGAKRLEALEESLKKVNFVAAAQEQYEIKKEKYRTPETVNAAHVLIKLDGRTDADALKRAQDVRKKAVAGEDFAALAMQYSDDPSKEQNKGVLGVFKREQMVKPFEEAAFSLKTPGEISPVVKTPFGYHVIRLIEKQEARQQLFEEVKETMVRELEAQRITETRAGYIGKIKNDESIVIHEEAIEALRN
jgi:peptidyl-prolyl cis-trans isomerase C